MTKKSQRWPPCVQFQPSIKHRQAPDSTDPTYRPTVYDYGEPGTETVTIIGRVVWYTLPFDWGF